MALPSPNLDDRRFQQFVDDAKRYVQQRCPEWTDHNVSDPGVTLIEAVAYMADQLVYRLNRVPDKNYLAFLDLLGINRFPPAPARAEVTFRLSAPQPNTVLVPPGSEIATLRTESEEALVFGTAEQLRIVPCSLTAVVVQNNGASPTDRTVDVMDGKDVAAFSPAPAPGDALYFGLSAPVPSCVAVLRLSSRVDGVGVDPRQPPLVWEAWSADGWVPCEVDSDDTGGLNRPGDVALHVPSRHIVSRLAGVEAAWLRCRVLEPRPAQPFYAVSPTLRSAAARTMGGTVRAVHAETVRDEEIGESSGVAGQRFRLSRTPVAVDDPMLQLETSDGEGWDRWQLVDTFAGSSPEDRHFQLDPVTGELAFGPALRQPDGGVRQYGMVPLKGMRIRAAAYRIGGGRSGNVARGALSVLRTSIPYVSRVENREAARGGVDGESVAEAKVRAPISLRAQDRAVTVRDYEELTRRAAPEAARIHCLPVDEQTKIGGKEVGLGAVRLLVVPQAVPDVGGVLRFEQLVPGDELLSRIAAYLDERRPIGTRLAVGPPYYQGVTAAVTLHAFRGAETDLVRTGAVNALYSYLDPLTGGPTGEGWPFGRAVHSGELYAVLQRVPGVEMVDEVRLHPADPLTGKRGDAAERIELDPSALVFSYDHRVKVVGG
ncbi:putative baseplate assembly protein [Catenulispora sp. NF23]|uniref:putative baseplate assembly protein n=1 Tax=Catenulispora pinistramenti TaxID=2705254 RepID=UPI001BAC3B71|nr:putative baseplate assembly protein [Catenulispora pinistramenti]MBS2537013.1 putative baseplate assembly protein [Catenulispora pinistramenti]